MASVYSAYFAHSASTLSIRVRSGLDSSLEDEALYVGKIEIYIDKCHSNCKTCSDSTSSTCTACFSSAPQPDAALVSGSCVCPTNSAINSNGICICNANFYLDEVARSCVSTCPTHYFANTGTGKCQVCDVTCVECSGSSSSQCTSCNTPSRALSGGQCLCQPGYYNTGLQACP